MNRKTVFIFALWFTVLPAASFAQADWLKGKLDEIQASDLGGIQGIKPAGPKIVQGLKEALQVGITKAVKKVGQADGFFKNDKIKLRMPEELGTLDKALRTVGYSPQLDEFVLSMNRAAEKAAPAAQKIFVESIFHLDFKDAENIYNGGNTAATDYLKKVNYDTLVAAFQPVVKEALKEYDVTSKYQIVVDKYQTIPFAKNFAMPDIDQYVIAKSLDGLFLVLGQEEHRIRTEPQARVTNLLKEVFK